MSETRVARVMSSWEAPAARAAGTLVAGRMAETPASLYRRLHRSLWSACHEERRPGLFVFALHVRHGLVGRLWLSATEAPRAGTLGRHQFTDLSLTADGGLSLRHVLFVVRLIDARVRFSAIDLETPNGLHTSLGPQHVTHAESPTLLRTAALSFFCVPTGPRPSLPEAADLAWLAFDEVPPAPQAGRWSWLKTALPPIGVMTLTVNTGTFTLPVDDAMAKRGVLIGRDERCDALIPDNYVSRVHAAVVSIDGAPFLIDCGSTNGIPVVGRGEDARCWRLEDGDQFQFGRAVLEWRAVQ